MTGKTHRIFVHDGGDLGVADAVVGDKPLVTRSYRVVNVLSKRGQVWPEGSTIVLDIDTGARFLAAGDVTELEEENQ